ncbi:MULTISPECIES: helix-turn-helix domain-containing protein [Lentzea]|uniref:Helix-turn-helix domain-containing protein n=1 Tax=Lentzea albida TaxID=65499 RepID=A0A1H9GM16_9PSEU|nr:MULTISPECIES: helix-turn-helix transcriptional regulator [Lentzea]USX52360.1 helix-turn-helix domain-containing protein [Lentzea sp. HUAS12]SEQ51053.1 Helix-turn-helix domain-containing protein [Lentzea albida]
MPKDFRATTLERAIGRQLAGWRAERELSLTEAGQRVGFSSAKLSMMENAVQPSAPVDVMALGYVYKVPVVEWQAVVARAQHAERARKGAGHPVNFDPAADFANLVFEATVLRAFTLDLVPAVFQLPGYTDAVMQTDDPVRTARLAMVREAWATRLRDKDPLTVQAVFPEAVLRQVVGGPRVMKAQLLHLMEVSEHETVSVRVVPRGAGAYPAMGSPFTLLGFAHRQHDDVAYLETFVKGEYVEEPGMTEQCAQRFAGLREVALGEGESLELVAEAAAEL